MNTLSLIRNFLQERLDIEPGRVTPESALDDLGVDSLMLLELMFEFEEKLNINLTRDMASPRTVQDLLAIVERMQSSQASN